MELIHPTKFESRKKATAAQQRALIRDIKKLYPFAVQNVSATEHNLNVLYNNEEIKILLNEVVSERDALVKKQERGQKRIHTSASTAEGEDGANRGQPSNVEEADEFEIDDAGNDIDVDVVREGARHFLHGSQVALGNCRCVLHIALLERWSHHDGYLKLYVGDRRKQLFPRLASVSPSLL
eukprot:Seg3263.3 transcript_id=Seg3263.3/GoldUCD/mRNA.D3Y31 product="hypothetical protein" protein_id=Seg3263.3/GoldUCD/D3Y31